MIQIIEPHGKVPPWSVFYYGNVTDPTPQTVKQVDLCTGTLHCDIKKMPHLTYYSLKFVFTYPFKTQL